MGFALLLLVAPALGRTPKRTAALSPDAENPDVSVLACNTCGQKNAAAPNCCSEGGSWEGLCDGDQHKRNGSEFTHTWHAGFQACRPSPPADRQKDVAVGARKSSNKPRRLSVKGGAVSNSCAQCGYDEDGVANCCTHGGSWMGTCREEPTRSGQHSFTEGYDVCHVGATSNDTKPTNRSRKWWSMDKLSSLFKKGAPSNHLSLVGLTVHCFDNTEDPQELWKPCTSGFCKQFGGWWSASIINTKQHNTYGGSGIIMSPQYTKVLCSHWADMGTMEKGCDVIADHDAADVIADRVDAKIQDEAREKEQRDKVQTEREGWIEQRNAERDRRLKQAAEDRRNARPKLRTREEEAVAGKSSPYKPAQLKEMLEHSMDPQNNGPMNEVLIDSKYYLDNLPESISAIFYFHDASLYERTMATRAYVGMLEKYNLTENDLKLLKVHHNAALMKDTGTRMSDESAGARHFLSSHPWGKKFRRRQVPQEAPTETWRRQRLARRDDAMRRQRLARYKARPHPGHD